MSAGTAVVYMANTPGRVRACTRIIPAEHAPRECQPSGEKGKGECGPNGMKGCTHAGNSMDRGEKWGPAGRAGGMCVHARLGLENFAGRAILVITSALRKLKLLPAEHAEVSGVFLLGTIVPFPSISAAPVLSGGYGR